MKKVNSDSKLTKAHLIIVFVGVFLGLSLFRAIRSHMNSNDEMNTTLIEVDGKSYVVLTPKNIDIDKKPLDELLSGPDHKKFVNETK